MSVKYSVYNTTRGNVNVVQHYKKYLFYSPCADSKDCTPYKVTLSSGTYKFEAWGSAGSGSKPGKGAFVEGTLILLESRTLYFYIGTMSGFNSAKIITEKYFFKAGGATDVRTVPGDWNDFESLKSRILVAGGGGSAEWPGSKGGDSGLNGTTGYGCLRHDSIDFSEENYCHGGTQTSGGEGSKNSSMYGILRSTFNGTFGSSGDNIVSNDFGGVGGGGYYGGASVDYAGAGGGGSSFISGHHECDAIHESSTSKESIIHTHQSVHYSRLIFYHTKISDGTEVIPHYTQGFSEKGNTKVGAIRLTIIKKICTNRATRYDKNFLFSYIMFITFYK